MNKGYWIAIYKKIENQENLGNYGKKATQAIVAHGGKPLVRGGKYVTLEGNNIPRTVIREFENYDAAVACYNSKEYQDAWALAKSTTFRDLEIVEGV